MTSRIRGAARTCALIALTLVALPVTRHNADAASFNCSANGLNGNELAICNTRDLNDMDVEMATMYRMLTGLFMMGRRGAMQDDQAAWLKWRQSCGTDVPCIRNAYKVRIEELQAIYDSIDKPL